MSNHPETSRGIESPHIQDLRKAQLLAQHMFLKYPPERPFMFPVSQEAVVMLKPGGIEQGNGLAIYRRRTPGQAKWDHQALAITTFQPDEPKVVHKTYTLGKDGIVKVHEHQKQEDYPDDTSLEHIQYRHVKGRIFEVLDRSSHKETPVTTTQLRGVLEHLRRRSEKPWATHEKRAETAAELFTNFLDGTPDLIQTRTTEFLVGYNNYALTLVEELHGEPIRVALQRKGLYGLSPQGDPIRAQETWHFHRLFAMNGYDRILTNGDVPSHVTIRLGTKGLDLSEPAVDHNEIIRGLALMQELAA